MRELRPHQELAITQIRHSLARGEVETRVDGTRWAAISGCERYWVSELGEVASTARSGRLLKQNKTNAGYFYVSLMIDGKPIKKTVHRLVAGAFVRGMGDVVNHKDGRKENNKSGNLEWCSYAENNDHARDNRLTKNFGELHYAAKLKESDIPVIRSLVSSGALHREVACRYGVNRQTITKVVNGKAWRRAG